MDINELLNPSAQNDLTHNDSSCSNYPTNLSNTSDKCHAVGTAARSQLSPSRRTAIESVVAADYTTSQSFTYSNIIPPSTSRSSISSLANYTSDMVLSPVDTGAMNQASYPESNYNIYSRRSSISAFGQSLRTPNFSGSDFVSTANSAFPQVVTPAASEHSPSSISNNYFQSQNSVSKYTSAAKLSSDSSLAAFATLATEGTFPIEEEVDVLDAAEVLTNAQRPESRFSSTSTSLRCSRNDVTNFQSNASSPTDTWTTIDRSAITSKCNSSVPFQYHRQNGDSLELHDQQIAALCVTSPTMPKGTDVSASNTNNNYANCEHDQDRLFDLGSAPKCSYMENCTTSSPLRKVVSHIFGRNKLSTRQIPKNLWVYYCRKHYQRSRYRNPKGFAKLQCELVRRQVERLAEWGGVKDWVVKVRRREEMRLSREKGSPSRGSISDESCSEHENIRNKGRIVRRSSEDRNRENKNHWLISMVGVSKSLAHIRRLLDRIENEVVNSGCSFPDVEILPNVCPRPREPSSKQQTSAGPDVEPSSTRAENMCDGPDRTKTKKRKKLEDLFPTTELQRGPTPHSPITTAKVTDENVLSTFSMVHNPIQKAKEPLKDKSIVQKRPLPILTSPVPRAVPSKYAAPNMRHKRKASKSFLPYDQDVKLQSTSFDMPASPTSTINSSILSDWGSWSLNDSASSRQLKTARLESQYPTRAGEDSDPAYHTTLSTSENEYTLRSGNPSDNVFLPPPSVDDMQRRKRRPSMDAYGGYSNRLVPITPSKYVHVSDLVVHGKSNTSIINNSIVTPPPSASSISGRSSIEPEGDDSLRANEQLRRLSIITGLDRGQNIDASKYVQDYIAGCSPKRVTRMSQNTATKSNRQFVSKSLGSHHQHNVKRKPGVTSPLDVQFRQDNLSMVPANNYQLADTSRRFNSRQTLDDTPRGRTVSFALANAKQSSPGILPQYERRRSTPSSPRMPSSNPPTASRKVPRASSAGPTRKKSAAFSAQMKRTHTAPIKPVISTR